MTDSPYQPYKSAPGHTQELGQEKPGIASTLIRFTDGSMLRVWWDGRYEVAGLHEGSFGSLTIYCPPPPGRKAFRRLHFPWHRIDMVDHLEREDEALEHEEVE